MFRHDASLFSEMNVGYASDLNQIQKGGRVVSNKNPRNLPSVVTEVEARTLKICPLSMSRENPQSCVGSQCMGWSWSFWRKERGVPGADPVGRCGFAAEGLPVPVNGKGYYCTVEYGDDDEEVDEI